MARTGADYLRSLQDGRSVYLDGQTVDVTAHPGFQRTAASFARLYDFQHAPENRELMTIASPSSGTRVNRSWDLPTTLEQLVRRREAIAAWSALHLGYLGRSPDHLATTLGAMVMGIEVFRKNGSERADALLNYFQHVRDNDLFVTYVIQNPQADKANSPSGAPRELVARIVDESDAGITIRGAKMLGTSTVFSDEIFVGNVQPLKPGEERYAVSFAIPVNTKGLKLMSRRSYEGAATSAFDYPLSSHFDENDAIVYFDDVLVPWDRVFLKGDTDAMRAQWHDTPAHVYQNYQAMIRLSVKLNFLTGLARRIAETNGADAIPQIRGTLGHLAAQATAFEGLVAGMEMSGRQYGEYYVPSAKMVYSALTLAQEMYPRFVHQVRDLAGGGVIMLPSSAADFGNPETASVIEATQVSPVTDALGRVKVFKLAWDALGSEFGSRHLQYEMFYAGASYVNYANMFRTFDWHRSAEMVDHALGLMEDPPVQRARYAAAE